jgi:hypothetical protein
MKSYACYEGISKIDGTSIAPLDSFQTVDNKVNSKAKKVSIDVLKPLSDRKNVKDIKVTVIDKGEFKSKVINADGLMKKYQGNTIKVSFTINRNTDIGQIQKGDTYLTCASSNGLNPPKGTECEHKITKALDD